MRNNAQYFVDVVTILAQKNFRIRYRNSILGFLWSLLNPLAYMVILTLVFSLLLRVSVPHFAVFVLLGLLVWRFFSVGTVQGLFAIVENPSLVNKVYLPRYLIVLSSNIANLLGATLEFIALLPLVVILGVSLTLYVFLLPVVLIMEFLLIFGLSLALSALNLKYRDFYQMWDIALQLGFFLSPIAYDPRMIPPRYSFIYSLNPVTGLMQFIRTIFLYSELPSFLNVAVLLLAILIFLTIGFIVFRHFEPSFAEEI